ncbi:MAG: hypothetical protein NDJ89_18550 [Oligoflexia bacterium]|nr:hypothetical protein [Oligoflexia bacterium]
MNVFGPSGRIKSNAQEPVKPRFLVVLSLACLIATGGPHSLAPAAADEGLPEIEARTFDVTVSRQSRSGRVLLLEAPPGSLPSVGRILLLKRGPAPTVALRVLKLYPEKTSFAAKKLLLYAVDASFKKGDGYLAVEKVSDLVTPPPQTVSDRADLREIERADAIKADMAASPPPTAPTAEFSAASEPVTTALMPPPITPDGPAEIPPSPEIAPSPESPPEGDKLSQLDDFGGGPSPAAERAPGEALTAASGETAVPDQPVQEQSSNAAPAEEPPATPETISRNPDFTEEEDESSGLVVEELPILDPHSHWLTAAFAQLPNAGDYFSGGGLRYGFTLRNLSFLRRPEAQDSFAIEAGVFSYNILNYVDDGDSYLVVEPIGTLRYSIYFRDDFGIFFYGGLAYKLAYATSEIPTPEDALDRAISLSGITPALGTGLIFRVGPNWDARVDIGIDIVGLGIMLRF